MATLPIVERDGRTKRYNPVEIRAALTTLAFYGGNARRAAKETGVKPATLHLWRATLHRDLYLEIQAKEGPKLEAIAADQALEVILRASETEHALLDALETVARDPTQSKTSSELAGALQRASTAKGINTTKRLELTGRPTSVVEHRDGTEILRRLGSKVPGLVMEASATELPAAQGSNQPLNSSSGQKLLTAPDRANAREMVQTTPEP